MELPNDNVPIKPRTFDELVKNVVDNTKTEGLLLEFGGGKSPIYPERLRNIDIEFGGPGDRVDLFRSRRRLFGLGSPIGYKWPFADESVAFVYGGNFLEHVPEWGFFWREMARVMVPGGRAVFLFPYGLSNLFLQDPTHKQDLVEERFVYLNKEWRKYNGLGSYLGLDGVDFIHEFNPIYSWNEDVEHLPLSVKHERKRHQYNIVDFMGVFLKKNS